MPRLHGETSTDAFLSEGVSEQGSITLIEVLDDNWDTVLVFRHCQPSFITGMHAPVYMGISALELQAACALLQISPDADLIAGIKVMSEETARVYSKSKP